MNYYRWLQTVRQKKCEVMTIFKKYEEIVVFISQILPD